MAFNTLFDSGLTAYLGENADRPDRLWVFQHIPKCAGTSFSQELAKRLKKFKNLHIDYSAPESTQPTQWATGVQNFIAQHQASPVRLLFGHLRMPYIETLRGAVPDLRLILMLRDPVQRTISDFRAQMSPSHPNFERFRQRYATIDHYVDATQQSGNRIFKFLCLPGETVQDVIHRVESTYSFVGVLKYYPLSFAVATLLFGPRGQPALHHRKTEDAVENKVQADADLLRRIRTVNQNDAIIYDHFDRRYAASRTRLWEEINAIGRAASRPAGGPGQ